MPIGLEKKRILKKDLILGGYLVPEGVSVLLTTTYMYNEIIKKKLFLDDVFIKITFSASPVLNALDEFHARIKVYFKLKFAKIN